MQNANQEEIKQIEQEKELLDITYYTDPLCCWSWAFEPQWRKLRYQYEDKIKWTYRLCGMLPDWKSYDDPMNSVNRPVQMGPVWLEAKHISGMPMDEKIWFNNPPTSSYPACIAIKCAALQSARAEEWFLRRSREAVMLEGKDISKLETLIELAGDLSKEKPEIFSLEQFYEDWENKAGHEAFKKDLEKSRYHRIGRYPTLTIQKPGKRGVIITGYRPYEILVAAIKEVDPNIKLMRETGDADAYLAYWKNITERELREVTKENESAVKSDVIN